LVWTITAEPLAVVVVAGAALVLWVGADAAVEAALLLLVLLLLLPQPASSAIAAVAAAPRAIERVICPPDCWGRIAALTPQTQSSREPSRGHASGIPPRPHSYEPRPLRGGARVRAARALRAPG